MDTRPASLDITFSIAYEELRKMARGIIHGNGTREISATTLVTRRGSSCPRLPACLPSITCTSGESLRRPCWFILVDAARRRSSKTMGADAPTVTFDESLHYGCTFRLGPELLDLNTALDTLASLSPRQADLIEARFFGGMTADEMVRLFDLSDVNRGSGVAYGQSMAGEGDSPISQTDSHSSLRGSHGRTALECLAGSLRSSRCVTAR